MLDEHITEHDYPEDHEGHGHYIHVCTICGKPFVAHQSRIICKSCNNIPDESEYHTFIHSLHELKFFYDNVLPPLEPTDVYFVSLSARSKYLTEEEKEILNLGRTEMFCKTIIRKQGWDRFLRTIRKFECRKDGYTTKNGFCIPAKCITTYININPSNTLQALGNFKKVLTEYEIEIASIALKNRSNTSNIAERLNKLDNSLMTAYQQSRGQKHWIDIDCDINKTFKPHENTIIKDKFEELRLKTYWWIDTKSGYHLLLKRDELKFDPNKLISVVYEEYYKLMNELKLEYGKTEIIINKNEMIPLPGCYQGEHPVTILNKI